MIRYFFPMLMIAVSGGIYFLFIDPLYTDVVAHKKQIAQLDEALTNADKVIERRDELRTVVSNISDEDMDRLQKMLPMSVDNVRLILEIEQIATDHNMLLKNADVLPDSKNVGNVGPNLDPYGSIILRIALEGPYENFRTFVEDLDRALRIIDVSSMTVQVAGDKNSATRYELEVRAYWLK